MKDTTQIMEECTEASKRDIQSREAAMQMHIQNIKENSFLEGGQGQTFFEIVENMHAPMIRWKAKNYYFFEIVLPNNIYLYEPFELV